MTERREPTRDIQRAAKLAATFELGLRCNDCDELVELGLPLVTGQTETQMFERIGRENYAAFSTFLARHSGHSWLLVAIGPPIAPEPTQKSLIFQ